MFLKSFQGQEVIRGFSKKIHTQMCIASLFGRREHRKVEKNEWKDDDDEQKQIFYEEEKNSSLEKSKQEFKCVKCNIIKCSCSVMANKSESETYFIQYEGGVGILSK
jgi:hypothetical protein